MQAAPHSENVKIRNGSALQRAPAPTGGRIVFYTHNLCPYAQRVALGLLYKRLPFDLVHIDLSDKPGWYAGINPRGLVPALQYPGGVVVESLDILAWLDTHHPQPHSLTPGAAAARQHMQQLLAAAPGLVAAGIAAVAGTTGRPWGIGAAPSKHQLQGQAGALRPLQAALEGSGGPFLLGPGATLADCALMPFVDRFDLALEGGRAFRDAAGDAVLAWLAHMRADEPGRLTCAEPGLMRAALQRHRSLDFFDYDTYDATALHPQLQYLLAEGG